MLVVLFWCFCWLRFPHHLNPSHGSCIPIAHGEEHMRCKALPIMWRGLHGLATLLICDMSAQVLMHIQVCQVADYVQERAANLRAAHRICPGLCVGILQFNILP